MLRKEQILKYLGELNEELRKEGQKGEIGIIGGAAMCLVFNARNSTRDVDAVFEPSQLIRIAAKKIGQRHRLSEDWINDAAKGFLTANFKKTEIITLSNLVIWAPEARYMLAMKCISARWDTMDRDDVVFLLKYLNIDQPKDVFDLIQFYYPKNKIPAKTQFFIEEILS